MARILKSAPVVRQQMDWRTTSNVIDCGIFAMRHMETYMGQMTDWGCGLAKEDAPNELQQKQLNDLRMKYTVKKPAASQIENRKEVVKPVRNILDLREAKINELYKTGHKRIEQMMEQYID
ncbi:hypothetical protein Hanom_Chr09g00780011 [Helianthus anomalus]